MKKIAIFITFLVLALSCTGGYWYYASSSRASLNGLEHVGSTAYDLSSIGQELMDNYIEEQANKKIIAIDPGHQAYGNYDKEPDGPGSSTTKAKVTTGTSGAYSGLKESELNLIVALKLQAILEEQGHTVVMIRTTQDVDISNSERAAIANEAGADVFIRIHADGSENSSAQGAMTICSTSKNPYFIGTLYNESRLLSELVLDGMVEETGFKKRSIWETDTMSGINWCEVPVTIVEMGFMTNKEEDLKMATDEYQTKFAWGMANGINAYFDAMDDK